jgi:hypothetical protein
VSSGEDGRGRHTLAPFGEDKDEDEDEQEARVGQPAGEEARVCVGLGMKCAHMTR